MSTQTQSSQSSGKKTFEHRDDSGTLFYDAPGAPTLAGEIRCGKTYAVTAEPAVDKNQRDYVKIAGDGVSGGLFVNDRKEQERHPDFTGPIDFEGRKMRMSAWKKPIKSGPNAGTEFLSIAVSEPYQKQDG